MQHDQQLVDEVVDLGKVGIVDRVVDCDRVEPEADRFESTLVVTRIDGDIDPCPAVGDRGRLGSLDQLGMVGTVRNSVARISIAEILSGLEGWIADVHSVAADDATCAVAARWLPGPPVSGLWIACGRPWIRPAHDDRAAPGGILGAVPEQAVSMQRLLVVDDEHSIVDAVSTALRYEGFDVSTAASGRAAFAAAQEGEFDLIVLDVMLPDLDGFEVATRFRADGIDTPILFLTARTGLDDKVRRSRPVPTTT